MDMKEKKAQHKVKCPQCGLSTIYSPENPFRPFCSERCKTFDLAHWANGTYSIPLEQSAPSRESELTSDLTEEDLDNFQ
ncbi:MAG TPA: DNA gyrase inhibitor YacG [Pseudobdellovibrionaceae bacterium]|jgi:hypothetical protein